MHQGGWVPLARVLVLISQIIYRRAQKDSKQTLYWKDVGVFEKRTSIRRTVLVASPVRTSLEEGWGVVFYELRDTEEMGVLHWG